MIAMQPATAQSIALTSGRLFGPTLLVKAQVTPLGSESRAPREQPMWCELTASELNRVACYEDLDGDQRLESAYRGTVVHRREPLSIHLISHREPISPMSYRPATNEEMPRLRVGYASCAPVRSLDEVRFETVVRAEGIKGAILKTESTGCAQIAKLLEGSAPARMQVDRFVVEVAESNGHYSTKLVQGIDAGTMVGGLRSDQGIEDIGAVKATSQRVQELSRSPVEFAADVPVANRIVMEGEAIVTAPATHPFAGRLAEPLLLSSLLGRQEFPRGTSAYGVPTISSKGGAAGLIWCIPNKVKDIWSVTCLAPRQIGYGVGKPIGPAFAVLGILPGNEMSASSFAPIVERGPADFGAPLVATIRFKEWGKTGAIIAFDVAPEGESTPAYERRIGKAKGEAAFCVGGVEFKLTAIPDKKGAAKVEVSGPTVLARGYPAPIAHPEGGSCLTAPASD